MAIGKKKKLIEGRIYATPYLQQDTNSIYGDTTFTPDHPPRDLVNPDHREQIRDLGGKLWQAGWPDWAGSTAARRWPQEFGLTLGHRPLYSAARAEFPGGHRIAPLFTIEYVGEAEEIQREGDLFPTITQFIRLIPNVQGVGWLAAKDGISKAAVWEDLQHSIEHEGYSRRDDPESTRGLLYRRPLFGATDSDSGGGQTFWSLHGHRFWPDFPFEYDSPHEYLEASGVAIDNTVTLIAEVKPEYNFYVNRYEGLIRTIDGVEPILPCMYSFVSEKEGGWLDADESPFKQHISLKGDIEGVYEDKMIGGKKVGEVDSGFYNYFDTWSKTYEKIETYRKLFPDFIQPTDEIKERFSKVVFSQADIDFLIEHNDKKHMFPMYMELKFSTGAGTRVADILHQTHLGADLINYVLNTAGSGEHSFATSSDAPWQFLYLEMGLPPLPELDGASYESWDIEEWLGTLGQPRESGQRVIVSRKEQKEFRIIEEHEPQIAFLLKVLFMGRIGNLIKESSRSLQEMFEEGKLAHSETVFYEIEKFSSYRTDSGREVMTEEPIQKFFIPNSSKLGICNFIDTQVQYDTGYKYVIHAYQLVLGAQYQYQTSINYDEAQTDIGPVHVPRIGVDIKPLIKIVKVPYYDSGIKRVVDKPPVAPDVNIIPYMGITDRLLFNLNANVGTYKLLPVAVEEGEMAELDRIRSIQQHPSPFHDHIEYESDDPPESFLAYRLSERPQSYEDFAGKQIRNISTKSGFINLSAISFVDNIQPNIKFYYMFRTVDVHQNVSFPSPIYEVEMVESDGANYLTIDILELKRPIPRNTSTEMSNQLVIRPSFQHRHVNIEQTLEMATSQGDPVQNGRQLFSGHIILGKNGESNIWGRRFKFRFISKHTGRKFDVNVKFKHQHRNNEEPNPHDY